MTSPLARIILSILGIELPIYAHHRSPQPTRAALAAERERLAALCDQAAALCGTLHRAFLRVAE